MASKFIAILFIVFCVATPIAAQNQTVNVGVILDGPSERYAVMQREFEKQIIEFFSGEYDVRFAPENVIAGDWTVAGIKVAVERMLANKKVELVLALGAISSNEIALRKNLTKPMIACAVLDAGLQGLPKKDGSSGVKNLNYLDESYSVSRTIQLFQEIVPFKKLALLVGPAILEAIPQLPERATQEVPALGAKLEFVPVTTAAATALQALPADADAVYIAPLPQMSSGEFDALVAGLTQRRLPTFSYLGKDEVEKGVMAAYAQKDDLTRRARRIASTMQRILRGEDAGTLPVDFAPAAQLTINMATARAIGFHPNWKTLTEAELINQEDEDAGRKLSLTESVRLAVQVNLDLMAANKEVESGAQDVKQARASLLPQVGASTSGTLVRKESAEASFGLQPERQIDGALSFSQSLYSESDWSKFSIEKNLQKAREQDRDRLRLDIALQAASAYLNVLRAKALARIQRSNLKLTLDNLDLARLRESVGASGRSDVYRWESQVATGRKNVIDADAQVEVAKTEVNRVLNRPLEERFTTEETAIDDPILITSEKQLFNYFANPKTFAVFREFMVEEGVSAAPELKQLDAAIAAQKRAHTAAGRSFWV
ncbi:MAG: ABC transporter substrate binding protein, partial [bacterium]